MTLTLDLPKELERELAAEAKRLRLPLHEYAMRLLSSARPGEGSPRSGAELVAYWQKEDIVGSRADITDSQEHARRLREEATRRRRE